MHCALTAKFRPWVEAKIDVRIYNICQYFYGISETDADCGVITFAVCCDNQVVNSPFTSVLWHFWLGVRKSIRPVNNFSGEVLAWFSVWSKVQMICIWSSWCHCHRIISCFIQIQIGLNFLVPAYPGCPGSRGRQIGVCLASVMIGGCDLWHFLKQTFHLPVSCQGHLQEGRR